METISGSGNWKLLACREGAGVAILRAVTCDGEAALPGELWGLPVTALGSRALSPSVSGGPPETWEASGTGDRTLRTGNETFRAGDGAFYPGSVPSEGEVRAVQILCTRAGAWDNGGLRSLSLPHTLRRVGDYALYNCRALERLRLYDGVSVWGGGVFLNCGALGRIELVWDGPDRGTLSYLAGELNRETDISVHTERPQYTENPQDAESPRDHGPGDRIRFRLIFPEYRELYEENSPAHHFDYVIEGAGYPYRRCFRDRQVDLMEYDRLWNGLIHSSAVRGTEAGSGLSHLDYRNRTVPGGWYYERRQAAETGNAPGVSASPFQTAPAELPEGGEMTALRLAWWRLRYPEGLTGAAERAYLRWIHLHGAALAAWLIREGDVLGLRYFLRIDPPDRNILQSAAAAARENRNPEALALLLEELHRRFPARRGKRFAL